MKWIVAGLEDEQNSDVNKELADDAAKLTAAARELGLLCKQHDHEIVPV